MKIAQLRKYDVANGPGIRTTVFVSGCTHNCKNCFNKEYQNFGYGVEYNSGIYDEIVKCIKETGKLSILGGEPLQQGWEFVDFLKRIKEDTNANIWMWTGYKIEDVINPIRGGLYRRAALKFIDVLVDGPFIESKKDLTLKFRGSSNQRIINVKETLLKNEVIIMEV